MGRPWLTSAMALSVEARNTTSRIILFVTGWRMIVVVPCIYWGDNGPFDRDGSALPVGLCLFLVEGLLFVSFVRVIPAGRATGPQHFFDNSLPAIATKTILSVLPRKCFPFHSSIPLGRGENRPTEVRKLANLWQHRGITMTYTAQNCFVSARRRGAGGSNFGEGNCQVSR
jgi:hypothetical protein